MKKRLLALLLAALTALSLTACGAEEHVGLVHYRFFL